MSSIMVCLFWNKIVLKVDILREQRVKKIMEKEFMVLLAYAISIIRTELARHMNKTFSFTYIIMNNLVQSPICCKHLCNYMYVSLSHFLMHNKMVNSSHNTIMEKVRGRSSINICFTEAERSINQFGTQEPCGVLRMLHSSAQCGARAGRSSAGHIKLNYS